MTLLWIGIMLWSLIAIVGGSIFFYIRYKKAKARLSDEISEFCEEGQKHEFNKLKVEHLKQVGIGVGGIIIIFMMPFLVGGLLVGSCFALFGLM